MVAIVLVLVVVAVGVAVVRSRAEAPPDPSSPRGVVAAYLRDLRAGRSDQAWGYLSSAVQARYPRDRFVQQAAYLANDRSRVTIGEATVDGNEARVPVTYHYDGGLFGGSSSNPRLTLLVQEGGGWRISSPPEPFLPEFERFGP